MIKKCPLTSWFYIDGTGVLIDDVQEMIRKGDSEEEIGIRFGITLAQVREARYFTVPENN